MSHKLQKGKNMKRHKSWHRGRGEARRFQRAINKLPFDKITPSEEFVDPKPVPVAHIGGRKIHHDSI